MNAAAGAGSPGRSVVTVSFAPLGHSRDYRVDPRKQDLRPGALVIVESGRGLALGRVIAAAHPQGASSGGRLRRVVRAAQDTDLRAQREAEQREPEALRLALRELRRQRLPLRIVRVVLDGVAKRAHFVFSAAEQQDITALRETLNEQLGMHVELRQIGPRDIAKVAGGVGRCGLTLCCSTHLRECPRPSIRHAKDQGLSLQPEASLGCCGKALCCLVYEHPLYKELRAFLPKTGKRARTNAGLSGRVIAVDPMRLTFTLLDKERRRVVVPAEDWERNEGKQLPAPEFPRHGTHSPQPTRATKDDGYGQLTGSVEGSSRELQDATQRKRRRRKPRGPRRPEENP